MPTRFPNTWLVWVAGMAAALAVPSRLRGEPAFVRSFDGPETIWKLVDSGTHAQVLAQEILPGGARDNSGFERLVVAAGAGESAQFECSVRPVAVLDELQVRMWVRSTRPDIQIAAKVRLPRSVGPQGDGMATAIVKGAAYDRPGHWQELVVTNVPKLLAAQARIMRTAPGALVDVREAYIEAIVLIVPGEPKGVEVATDRCEIEGVIVERIHEPKRAPLGGGELASPAKAASAGPPSAAVQVGYEEVSRADRPFAAVQLQGGTLVVEGKPFLTRGVEWQNEPLKFLAERGFNVVKLASPPNPQQIVDANRHDLWFICTPPRPAKIAADGLGAAGDRVLAWYLEDEAIDADASYMLRWAEAIRDRDAVHGRPVLLDTTTAVDTIAEAADVLVCLDSRVSLLTGAEFAESLRNAGNQSRPGTPLWAAFNTQSSDAVRDQIGLLTSIAGPAPEVDYDQLRSLLGVASTSGVRGYLFRSRSSLSENDPSTRARAATVELLNRRLQLMEGWLAGGKVVSSITSTSGGVTAAVLYVDRARLLVPVFDGQPGQATANAANPAKNEIVFLVPGVSQTSTVHFLTPASLRTLASERVAGGTKFVVPSADGMVLITEDPKVVHSIRQHIARHGAQMLRLERELIAERAKSVLQTDQKLTQFGFKPLLEPSWAAEVNSRIAQADAAMSSGRFDQAEKLLNEVKADIRRAATDRQRQVLPPDSLQSNALALSAKRLPDLAALEQSIRQLRASDNLLDAGDFESLSAMTQVGWQHIVHARAGGEASAELSAERPHSGAYCLKLAASPRLNQAGVTRGNPLVWIVSPPVPVDASQLVEITGWVRVDAAFSQPGSGLVIMDTIGGPELSLIVGQTAGWQSFRMLRAVPRATEMRLTFALTGVGAGEVDDVMIRTLEPPKPRRLPETTGIVPEEPTATAEAPGPVTRLPNPR